MNPRVSKTGRSFVGAVQYYSHDKNQANTSDRLGKVWLFNLPLTSSGDGVADSERAAKIMAFTATNWEDIQRLHHENRLMAGETDKPYRRPPRPPEKPVYSFALRFHPDDKDKVTPALLEEAVRGSLEAVGMSDLQAIAFEHTDFEVTDEYPEHGSHVHVVVNRIDPVTGFSRSYSRDQYKLSRFAEEFGAKHGLKPVEQRIENNERRAKGELVYDKSLSRADYERFKHYRKKTVQTIRKERAQQQLADERDLQGRHSAKRRAFELDLNQSYAASESYFKEELAETQRSITLDHMGAVFKVFTRLKQRFTGELKRERARKANLERSLKKIEVDKQRALKAFEQTLQEDRAKLSAVHAAQLENDEEYFEYRRRYRRTETAGESGRKSFNAKRQKDTTQEPQPWLKAQILREQKAAANLEAHASANMSPSEKHAQALKDEVKKWSRKDGRGANKTEGRKRKRTRKRTHRPS